MDRQENSLAKPVLNRRKEKVESATKSYLPLLEEAFPGIKTTMTRCEELGIVWGGKGRIFVKEEEGKAVCHVGYYEASALIEGTWCKIGALHAICTLSSCRNLGYASQLIIEALQWAKERASIVLLFTDIPKFYTRLSFQEIQEYRFRLLCNHKQGNAVLKQMHIPSDKELFLRCFREREPLSYRFWIKDTGDIASFNTLYSSYPTFNNLYYSSVFDGLISFVLENKTLHLFDVIAKKLPSLEVILEHFPSPIEEVFFYFSPDRLTSLTIPEPYFMMEGILWFMVLCRL